MKLNRAIAIGLVAAALAGAAQAQEPDPNLPAVKAVCGRCHGEAQFMDVAANSNNAATA